MKNHNNHGLYIRMLGIFACLIGGIIVSHFVYRNLSSDFSFDIYTESGVNKYIQKSIGFYIPLFVLQGFSIGLFLIPIFMFFRGMIFGYSIAVIIDTNTAELSCILVRHALPSAIQICGLLYFSGVALKICYLRKRGIKGIYNISDLHRGFGVSACLIVLQSIFEYTISMII